MPPPLLIPENLSGFRIHLGPNVAKIDVVAAIKDWQLRMKSQIRLFVREETAVFVGEEETWVIIEGITLPSRDPFGFFGFIGGLRDLSKFLCDRFSIDPDVARVIIYGGELYPANET